jgi:UDP-N-acetylmuramoyl-tripeptide--D-alanyl-D-alanine ligase
MNLPTALLTALWGTPLGDPQRLPAALEAVSTDSRAALGGALFVPLLGERFDGHRFLAAALAGGAAAAVAERSRLDDASLEALSQGAPVWLVPDTLQAYQQIAQLWRRQLGLPVVAVTGSAGKTTTRELIRAVLAPLGPVVASSGNENNDVGAPLTLLKAEAATAALVVEMGMRGLGEIERLSRCAEPDVAVITNIGTAHIGRLGSREAIATAKCEISAALRPEGLVVIPAGDPLLEAALATSWSGRVRRVALAGDALAPGTPPPDQLAELVESSEAGNGALRLPGWPVPLALPLPGRHNARNLLLALAVAEELGLDPHAALVELLRERALDLPGGRCRRLQRAGVAVLDETYNASPEAVLAALDLLAREPVAAGGRRYAVLGTMLELGEQSLTLHRQVAARAAELGRGGQLDGLLIVAEGPEGEAMLEAAAGLPRLERVATPEQGAERLTPWLRPGDALMLKASRGVALETLLERLPG